MTDVIECILDVDSANLLLQWSSAKGQSLAEGGVAKHGEVEVVSIWSSSLTRWFQPSNFENSRTIYNNLYSITELALDA